MMVMKLSKQSDKDTSSEAMTCIELFSWTIACQNAMDANLRGRSGAIWTKIALASPTFAA